ncbi:MAG TPA: TetR/AcrR family transcriptional regulator [Acidimicrobiales bacterium]
MGVNEDSAPGRRTQAERRSATRAALLEAGRELFAARGFAGAGQEDIVERAGVTRGALAHHFATKKGLFRAVVESLETELAEHIATAAMRGDDPMAHLRLGCLAFLDAALDPAVRRIVLLDAPAVLGWQAWREIDTTYGLGLVSAALEHCMEAGLVARRSVQPLAHILLAALNEAAMLVANADDPVATRVTVGQEVEHFLSSM